MIVIVSILIRQRNAMSATKPLRIINAITSLDLSFFFVVLTTSAVTTAKIVFNSMTRNYDKSYGTPTVLLIVVCSLVFLAMAVVASVFVWRKKQKQMSRFDVREVPIHDCK